MVKKAKKITRINFESIEIDFEATFFYQTKSIFNHFQPPWLTKSAYHTILINYLLKNFGCVCNRTQVTKTLVTQSTKGWTALHLLKNDLNYLPDVFHKWYNRNNKHLIFGKIFQ